MPTPLASAKLRRRMGELPKFREMQRRYSESRVPIGAKPPNKTMAWWYLSRSAKALLQSERMSGRFGGMPGQAPYWNIQEQGSPGANVKALYYIQQAVAIWRRTAGNEIRQWVGGYSFYQQSLGKK